MIAPPTRMSTPQKQRVPYWDNARWIAIVLVVIGHAILKLIGESDPAYELYLFIYAFHVPLFVAVSGYFAKTSPPGTRQMKRLLTDVVFPYLIFETVWTTIRWLLGGPFKLDYATASWTLWFLIALAIWRIALPYLALLRYPLLISIAISVAVGYLTSIDSTFAMSRTLGLLPFFVFGWKVRQWRVTARWLALPPALMWRWRAGSLALFTALAVFIVLNIGWLREIKLRRFLLYDEPYKAFGYDEIWAGGIRLALILFTVLLITAFLMLVPRSRTWFTDFGAATMYIYLLHTFLLYPFRESGILDGPQPWWVLPAMVLLSVAIAVLLSLTFVQRWFRPVVQPKGTWAFRK